MMKRHRINSLGTYTLELAQHILKLIGVLTAYRFKSIMLALLCMINNTVSCHALSLNSVKGMITNLNGAKFFVLELG